MWPSLLRIPFCILCGAWGLATTLAPFVAICKAEEPHVIADSHIESYADLPLPRIGIRQEDHAPFSGKGTACYVWVQMPQIPLQWGRVHNVFDIHYEHPYGLDLLGSRVLEGGALEFSHRMDKQPHVILVSKLTPEPGKVRFELRVELDPAMDGEKQLPEKLPYLNMCLSFERARGCFDSYPDPFPEFIGRSFIFTEKGQTFLDTIPRGKIDKRYGASDDDPRNNPPWIARYRAGSFTVPIIGVVSRDKQHLVAIGSDTSDAMAQAWVPCIHNFSQWAPEDALPDQQRWRWNVYIMPNDPDALRMRVARDFPGTPGGP